MSSSHENQVLALANTPSTPYYAVIFSTIRTYGRLLILGMHSASKSWWLP
jgi:hypothetical protein